MKPNSSRYFSLVLILALTGGRLPAAKPEFSSGLLGAYRLVMEIEDPIGKACLKYDVNPIWAKSICMYESGGNPDLNSHAGAKGYFQVMPRTFRSLHVRTNIEAGVKYLALMNKRYGREDYATAAYNGGPLFVDRNRAFKLETLQYVIGVGHIRSLLRIYEAEIRGQAAELAVRRVLEGDSWWSISKATGIPIILLRLHNPFLAHRGKLKPGNLLVVPKRGAALPFEVGAGVVDYVSRLGDHPLHLAFVFDVDADRMRRQNAIWRLQSLPPGTPIRIDLGFASSYEERLVKAGDTFLSIASGDPAGAWKLIRYSGRFDQVLKGGETLRVYAPRLEPKKKSSSRATIYRVHSGDTLFAIARRFHTTVSRLRRLNHLSRRGRIYPGQRLRVR